MTITVPTNPDAIEAVSFETGIPIETRDPATLSVLTEGGVTLRLVAPLGGAA